MEFKQEADGNSGVFIRSFVEEKDVKVNGWQVEVAPKGFDTGGIYESYGRGWLIQIPDEKENILNKESGTRCVSGYKEIMYRLGSTERDGKHPG